MARIIIHVERCSDLGYFMSATPEGGTSDGCEPRSPLIWFASSLEVVGAEVAKVRQAGHSCDVVHVIS